MVTEQHRTTMVETTFEKVISRILQQGLNKLNTHLYSLKCSFEVLPNITSIQKYSIDFAESFKSFQMLLWFWHASTARY